MDSAWFQERLDNENFWKSKEAEWKEEVLNSAYIQNLRLTHREYNIKSVVDMIVRKKIRIYTNEKFLVSEWDKHHLQNVEFARKLLDLILLKKLFNMECLWRAEELRIDGIEISGDFYYWSGDLQNCPFLEPITQREIEVLRMFMQTHGFEIKNWSWEMGMEYDFDSWMRKNEKGDLDQLPEFFEYYDSLMGTFYLLNKPNIRGEKEEFYKKIYYTHFGEEWERKQAETKDNPPVLPSFGPFSKAGTDLLLQTEPADFFELLEAFKVREQNLNGTFRKIALQEMETYFSRSGEEVFLPAWMVWDDGMEYTYNRHRNEKAANVLELALDEYQLKSELRMFDTTAIEKKKAECISRQYILKGRQLAGEKEDFEF